MESFCEPEIKNVRTILATLLMNWYLLWNWVFENISKFYITLLRLTKEAFASHVDAVVNLPIARGFSNLFRICAYEPNI